MYNTIRRLGWYSVLIILTLLSHQGYGQKRVPYVNSADSISLGISYADTGAYIRASSLYETVSSNDTNYVLALLEDAVAKESNEQDSTAIVLCRQGIEQESEYEPDFYNTLANVYMDEGNYSDAVKLLQDTVLSKYPNGHKLYFTVGLAQYKMHKYADAITSFQKSIDLDIYDASSHYYLGRCCLEQGRLIPALLSLQFYLVLQPEVSRSYTVIGLIEKMTANKYQYDKSYAVSPSLYHDSAFIELDLLIRSKIAFDNEYKPTTKISYNFAKQIQLLLEQLKYVPNTGNYWMEKYVPFFTSLQEKKYFEPYMYYIASSVNDPNFQKDIIKDKKKIKEFAKWAYGMLSTERSKKEIEVNGKKITVACSYFDNNMIESMGPQNTAGKNIGEWTFYYRHNGEIYSNGKYNDNGEREGKWQFFYSSGILQEADNFIKGKREDTAQVWYENGAPKVLCIYHNDLLNGNCLKYNVSGILIAKTTYNDDKLTGPATYFYDDGQQHYLANYIDGKLEGELKEYYVTGQLKLVKTMQNNIDNGIYTSYWSNGKVQQIGQYKDDKQVGHWKTYYKDGNIQNEGGFSLNGEKEGNWLFYFRNGKKEEYASYNKNGYLEGADSLFDDDGILYEIETYKNGILQNYIFKGKDGQLVGTRKLDGKTLPMTFFTPEGTKRSEGIYINNRREGNWKYYNGYGGIEVTQQYSKGQLNGVSTYYFANGKVQDSVNYTDGEQNGYYVSYYVNGIMNIQGWYVNGDKQGDWYYYDLKGSLIKHDFFVNGVVHGHTDFFETNGNLSEQHFYRYGYLDKIIDYDSTGAHITYKYVSDKGNGKFLLHYPNGNIAHEVNYVNGVSDGKEKRYFYGGKVSEEGQYILGECQDTMKAYYDNGNLEYVYNYDIGSWDGPAGNYYENGKTEEIAFYNDDELNGEQRYYYENGKISIVSYYENGNLEGERKVFYDDSIVSSIFWFHNGNLIAYSSAGKDGKPLQPISFDKGTGDVLCYYPNGNKSIQCKYVNGFILGKRLNYSLDGKLSSEENFELGYQNGPQKYYYEGDTALKQKDNYYYGELDGTRRYYYKNGKLEHEEVYKLGTKEGPCRYYDEDGKLMKTEVYFDGNEATETTAK